MLALANRVIFLAAVTVSSEGACTYLTFLSGFCIDSGSCGGGGGGCVLH